MIDLHEGTLPDFAPRGTPETSPRKNGSSMWASRARNGSFLYVTDYPMARTVPVPPGRRRGVC